MPNKTNITPPRVPLTDTHTGLVSREWYQFFLSLFNLTGAGQNSMSLTDLANTVKGYVTKTEFSNTVTDVKKGTTSANYVIAAPDTPAELKSRANYVYDPTTDVINNCIENIKTTGGLIKLLPGTYEIRENNWIFKNGTGNVSNVTIQGSGPSTVFKINSARADGGSNYVFNFTDNRSYYGITLEDFNVVGFGRTSGGTLIQAHRPANCTIDGLTLRNLNVSAISYLDIDSSTVNNIIFDHCKFIDMWGFSLQCSNVNGCTGRFIDSTFYNTSVIYCFGFSDLFITGCKFGTNSELRLDPYNTSPRVVITTNIFKDVSGFGILCNCSGTIIANNFFNGCGASRDVGYDFSAAIYIAATNCTVLGNTIIRPATNPGNHYGVYVGGYTGNSVGGNNLVNGGWTTGVKFNADIANPFNGPYNYVIAAPDTPEPMKSKADYVYDPTTDLINKAIDSLANKGGVIKLLPGTYEIETTNMLFNHYGGLSGGYDYRNLVIEGSGKSTILKPATGNSTACIKFQYCYGNSQSLTIRNMQIQGPGWGIANEIFKPPAFVYLIIEDVDFSNCSGIGIFGDNAGPLDNIIVRRCTFKNGGYGVYFGNYVHAVTIKDCTFDTLSHYGIYFGGDNHYPRSIIDNIFKSVTDIGIYLTGAESGRQVLVAGNDLYGCTKSAITAAAPAFIQNNSISNCGTVIESGSIGNQISVRTYGSNTSIIGNTLVRPSTQPAFSHYGIAVYGALIGILIDGNNVLNAGWTAPLYSEAVVNTFGVPEGSITNAMLAGSIELSKLDTDPLARANHTGEQVASTISDLATTVKAYSLDEFADPAADISMNSKKITLLATPTADTDAATKAYADTAITTANSVADGLSEHVGATGTAHGEATTETAGFMPAASVIKLAGIDENANKYVHPDSHPATMITEDETHRFVTDGEKESWTASVTADMLKSVYDTDGDGKVNSADVADAAPWSGITDKPSTYPPEAHTHPYEPELGNPTIDRSVLASMASGDRLWGKPTGITFESDPFADSSNSAKAVTVAGTVTVDTTHQTIGSSCLAFGGGYLTLADSDDWAFGTADFTFDFHGVISNTGVSQFLLGLGVDALNYLQINVGGTGILQFSCGYNNVTLADYRYTIPGGFWGVYHHLRISRSGSNVYFFIDGILTSWTTISTAIGTNAIPNFNSLLYVGSRAYSTSNYRFTGYLDTCRISVGICRSTESFTPVVYPYVADSYDKLLLNCDNELRVMVPAALVQESTTKRFVSDTEKDTWNAAGNAEPSLGNPTVDDMVLSSKTDGTRSWHTMAGGTTDVNPFLDSAKSAIITNFGAVANTSVKRFGASSLYVNGSTYFRVPHSTDLAFGTGDFTIDFCWRPDATGNKVLMSKGLTNGNMWEFQVINGNLFFFTLKYGTENEKDSTQMPYSVGTIYHIRVARASGTLYVFMDGVLKYSGSHVYEYDSTEPLYVGTRAGNVGHACYIDELHISKGIARSTSGFTPPTSQYVVDSYSVLLMHCDNQGTLPGGGHIIKDESTTLSQRSNLSFQGPGVTVTDDAGNDQTIVTIPLLSGTTSNRPTASSVTVGTFYFDTTLGKPTWSKSTCWVDATGATV